MELSRLFREAKTTFSDIRSLLNNPQLLKDKAFVNGKWVGAANEKYFEIHDPATRNVIGRVPDMDREDTRNAIAAANDAFPLWRSKTAKERSSILRAWHELIMKNKEDLACIITMENGKTKKESNGEVIYGSNYIEWYAEEAKRIYGDIIPENVPGRRLLVQRQPVGVSAMITPWNFPFGMITRKAAPALAVGCTVVLKPAAETPLTALALCVLAELAGMPSGVLNVVTSSHASDIGLEMSENPLVKKFSFTGSTVVGKTLYKQCADTVKKISLELGGNAPFIVFDDADVESAVKGLVACKFRVSGQTCICANRIYVHEHVYDKFLSLLTKAVEKLKMGHGLQNDVDLGPLINQKSMLKVKTLEHDAIQKGAKCIIGGVSSIKQWPLELKEHETCLFYPPTILVDMKDNMRISSEEIFGPLCAIYKFTSEDEVIKLANNTEHGLAGYFYSRDIGRIFRVAEALECGMIGVNEGIISTEVAPFGGVKLSGLGREGSYHGADEYLQTKYVCLGGIESTKS